MSRLEISKVEPIILSGPSGVGKSYMAKYLAEQFKYARLISTTTRAMRPGEVHGLDSNFIDDDTFTRLAVEANMRQRQDSEESIVKRLAKDREEAAFYESKGRNAYEFEIPASVEQFSTNVDVVADHFQLQPR